ncbi:MAG: hypothetical protein HY049_17035 [Acidobacteria bacterium]|nr:hypothetical protein [Acidobacteriota bacterium]
MFAVIGWSVYVIMHNRRQQAVAKTQAEMQAKLLDKLSSSQDLGEFLKTDAGRHLFDATTAPEPSSPYRRILGSVQAGLILALLGGATFLFAGKIPDADQELTVFGAMCSAVGVGFLISSVVSYKLSQSWGLFERRNGSAK